MDVTDALHEPPAHRVTLRIASPLSPAARHRIEDALASQLLDRVAPGSEIVGGGTVLSDRGEPLASDIELRLVTHRFDTLIDVLIGSLERGGLARGSWLRWHDARREIGLDEVVLLRTGTHDEAGAIDWDAVTRGVHSALGDGEIAWHDDTFAGVDGYVYVCSGRSAERILAALRDELRRRPELPDARLCSITPGAAEYEPHA